MVCYESQLNKEWFRIARTIKEIGNRSGGHQNNGGEVVVLGDVAPLWKFLDFIGKELKKPFKKIRTSSFHHCWQEDEKYRMV